MLENNMVLNNHNYLEGMQGEEKEEKPSSLYFLLLKVLKEEGEEEAIQLAKDVFSEIQLPREYEEELIDWAMEY